MFTGIIRHIGEVNHLRFSGSMARLQVETSMDLADIELGDSIAVNGICLTVVEIEKKKPSMLTFDLGPETLECSCLGSLRATESVHLEKAMQLSERINGHLVQGHVDGIGIVIHKEHSGDALLLKIAAPQEIIQLCVSKASITVDGVSLTINKVLSGSFELCLIPHTLQLTNFRKYEIGRRVNLENEMIGKYVYEFLRKPKQDDTSVSFDLLVKSGFMSADSDLGVHS